MTEEFLLMNSLPYIHTTYLRISELREGVYNDTEDDVEADSCDDDEEGHIKERYTNRLLEVIPHIALKLLRKGKQNTTT